MRNNTLWNHLKTISLVIGILICFGCTSVGQKMDEYSVSQKIDNFHSAIEQKMISFQKKLTRADDTENSQGKGGSAPDGKHFVHVTQWPSETLPCVARWYTGDTANWQVLAKVNPGIEPYHVAVGTSILIPDDMMIIRTDLPKDFAIANGRKYYEHRVRWPGESLSLIARWYTGSSKNWKILAKANPAINPNRIKGGDSIAIPADMLKTREPLPQKMAAKYTSAYFAYTVADPGETLADVAHWYTGSPENWKTLASANPKLNPDKLQVGAEIFIPAKLLKTREPKPRSSSPEVTPEKQKEIQPVRATTTQKKDAPIRLFGPKQFPKG